MRPRAALLLLNGELQDAAAARRAARAGAIVICADGGARHAAALGLAPKVVIGDMDSLPARRPAWPTTVYLCDFDPDLSDFEKALRFAVERGFSEALVAGAAGGRLDQTMVNLALVEKYAPLLRITLLERPRASVLGPGAHRLRGPRGRGITLLAVGPSCRVSASGLSYPLRGKLERGSRGLSNVAVSGEVRLRVLAGRLWVLGA